MAAGSPEGALDVVDECASSDAFNAAICSPKSVVLRRSIPIVVGASAGCSGGSATSPLFACARKVVDMHAPRDQA